MACVSLVNSTGRNLMLIDFVLFTVWMVGHFLMTCGRCRALKTYHHMLVCLQLLTSGHALAGTPVVRHTAPVERRTTLMAAAATCICSLSLIECGGPDARTTTSFATTEGWMCKDTTITRQSEASTVELFRDWLNRVIH